MAGWTSKHRGLASLRRIVTLLVMLLAASQAWATKYIKDVIVVGGASGVQVGSLLINYCVHQGWVKVDKNLNNNAGGDYIYLLYKPDNNEDGFNNDCITDFVFANTYNASLVYNGRTYYPVSYDGDDGFKGSKGNLNHGTSSSTKIYLYYTRDTFPDKRVVTGISFSISPIGPVCWNTGSSCNLNTGNDPSAILFMHLTTAPALEPVNIGDGTSGASYLPLQMHHSYSLVQQLYTAEEIGTAGTITAIAFYYRDTYHQSFSKEHTRVYLKQTTSSSLTGDKTEIVNASNGYTQVYGGAFSASGEGWVYLRFSDPYEYDGNKNLIVCCYDEGSTAYTGNQTFSVHSANNTAKSYGSDSHISLEEEHTSMALSSRNNIRINIEPNPYRNPINLALTGFTDETASISWSAPTGSHPTINHYEWQYKQAADENWSALSSTTSTTASLSGLSAFTEYLFQVKIVYNDGESSYSILRFFTAVELPYTCGFENGMPGWSQVDHNHYYNVDLTGISEAAKHDGNYGYMFRYYESDPVPQYLISPGLPGNTPIAVFFYYRNFAGSSPESFQVGYSTTTSEVGAFTWLEEITATGIEWSQYQHVFPEGTQYIAVKYSSNKYWLFLDDFEFVADSPYAKPTGLSVSELEDQRVTLQWTAPANATGYAYQYRPLNGDWSSVTEINSTSVTLNSLTANTTYDFRIKAHYGDNASNYVAIRFLTEGQAVSIPHSQDFENGMGGWRLENGHGRSGITTREKHSGANGFELDFEDGNLEDQYLRSPQLQGSASKLFTFFYKNYGEEVGDQITAYKSYFQVGRSNSGKRLTDFQMTSDYEASSAQWTRFRLQVPGDTQYVMIKLKGGSPWLYVDDIYVTEVPVPVATAATVMGETRYVTTFYDSAVNWQLPDGAWAYVVNKEGDDYVFYCLGDVIPADTPVIILMDKTNADTGSTKEIELSVTTAISNPYNNILKGTDSPKGVNGGKIDGHTVYVLGIADGKLGFYPFSGSEIPEKKAYIVD